MEKVSNKVDGDITPGRVIKFSQYVYERKYNWDNYTNVELYNQPDLSNQYLALIGIVEVTFKVPDDYDRTQVQVIALQKERIRKLDQFNRELAELDETTAQLSALTYTPSTSTTIEDDVEREFELKEAERRGEI
jgi:hypothetical protein